MAKDPLYDQLKLFRGQVIVIEGSISAGKTTLGKDMVELFSQQNIPAKFFSEYNNEQLLAQYIGDMKKYSYVFQLLMQAHRINNYKCAKEFSNAGGVAIVDRSIIGDYAFALMQKNKGYLSHDEWAIYLKIFTQENMIEPDGIIYLTCDIETIVERITKRGIDCEKSYNVQYLEDLANSYSQAFIQNNIQPLYIDWNYDRSEQTGNERAKYILSAYIQHFIRPIVISK